MTASGLVIQADLPTVLSVAAVLLVGLIVGPLIRRAWSDRRGRKLAVTVATAVVEALELREREDTTGPPKSA